AEFDLCVLAVDKTAFFQTAAKYVDQIRRFLRCTRAEKADYWYVRRLRERRERQRRCAADKGYELAPPHSITSSVVASHACGTVKPSAFAVLRLITVSYLVGACTGRSAGFSPLRTRSM